MENKGIFFLTMSFICIWLVLDNIFGKKYVDNFLSNIFPFYKNSSGNSGGNDVTGGSDDKPIDDITPETGLTDRVEKVFENKIGNIQDAFASIGGVFGSKGSSNDSITHKDKTENPSIDEYVESKLTLDNVLSGLGKYLHKYLGGGSAPLSLETISGGLGTDYNTDSNGNLKCIHCNYVLQTPKTSTGFADISSDKYRNVENKMREHIKTHK